MGNYDNGSFVKELPWSLKRLNKGVSGEWLGLRYDSSEYGDNDWCYYNGCQHNTRAMEKHLKKP